MPCFKHGVLDSLLFAVALAVGLTPELLPMILTVNLSKGALAMSEKGVIVKHLASIQNFGSMDTALHRQDRDTDREPDHADISRGCGEKHQ